MSEQPSKPLPCPFCGGENINLCESDKRFVPSFVECVDCMAFGPNGETIDQAIEAWNKRAGESRAYKNFVESGDNSRERARRGAGGVAGGDPIPRPQPVGLRPRRMARRCRNGGTEMTDYQESTGRLTGIYEGQHKTRNVEIYVEGAHIREVRIMWSDLFRELSQDELDAIAEAIVIENNLRDAEESERRTCEIGGLDEEGVNYG